MKKIKLKKKYGKFSINSIGFLWLLQELNNYSISGLYQTQKKTRWFFVFLKYIQYQKIIKSMYRCIFRIVYESI